MNYKYYFIIYYGILTPDSNDCVTCMQIGSKQDLAQFHSDAMVSWDNFQGEGDSDPHVWDRSDESDTTLVLGRGNELEILSTEFYAAIKKRLACNL